MLHGIDISNWQKGLTIPDGLDFIIAKATEGRTYVDRCCDGFIQQAIHKGMLFGFYHFARNNEPEAEAVFFRDNTIGYEGLGIPVLDIEDSEIGSWGSYARRFVDKYHAITGVYPVVYCSASYLSRFDAYNIARDCGLWVAGYPDGSPRRVTEIPRFPYHVEPWNAKAIWQFTNNGWIENWDEPIDADVAYLTREQWMLYATGGKRNEGDVTEKMPKIGERKEWTLKGDGITVTVKLE